VPCHVPSDNSRGTIQLMFIGGAHKSDWHDNIWEIRTSCRVVRVVPGNGHYRHLEWSRGTSLTEFAGFVARRYAS
jgi:hypothetical protein